MLRVLPQISSHILKRAVPSAVSRGAKTAAEEGKKVLRVLTAVAAYDGHDASIHAINRALRRTEDPVEVIYQGFNRKVPEMVKAAVEEGVDVVAISSYNGGHNQIFPALVDGLREAGSYAAVVGGGGGVITPEDKAFIEEKGTSRIFETGLSLDDVAHVVVDIARKKSTQRHEIPLKQLLARIVEGDRAALGEALTLVDSPIVNQEKREALNELAETASDSKVVFIMGDGGAGKSTITDGITSRFVKEHKDKKICILSVDPTAMNYSALLGDRVRMNAIYGEDRVFMRSLATRQPYGFLPASLETSIGLARAAGFDLVVVESPGTTQVGVDFKQYHPDLGIYVKTKEFGTVEVQLQKDLLFQEADVVVLNKIDREGSQNVFEQMQHFLMQLNPDCSVDEKLFATQAKIAKDPGIQNVYAHIMKKLGMATEKTFVSDVNPFQAVDSTLLVPHHRRNYLGAVAETVKDYDVWVDSQLTSHRKGGREALDNIAKDLLDSWEERWYELSKGDDNIYTNPNGISVPKVAFPDPRDEQEVLRMLLEEGMPGQFPFMNGVFPLRRDAMETTRQFAGLRLAENTNERFRLLSRGVDAPRLSTAFDGVTLYGDDSDMDPGSIGKIGEGGVAIDTLEDMKTMYGGFDPRCISTSLTINGPAPVILAMYFNVSMDVEIERYKTDHPKEVHDVQGKSIPKPNALSDTDIHPEYGLPVAKVKEIRDEVLTFLRGTVQADILKEIQAQNECIFQPDFAIKLMGDVQEYFVRKRAKKFYSISISGYHIGEAGATPIQEMAFTMANGFTYLENFLGRGMRVDEVAPNFSFFFRNSHELEWLALGPVCRKVWGVAMRDRYHASNTSQMFKYHTQTSGRALQLQEWDTLNPVRMTLHALVGMLSATNSLHVDSADEPLTTPSEKYVRQATMIPNVLSFEAEMLRQQNLLSGSYAFRRLNRQVQNALLDELTRLDHEGGVGAANEGGYHRAKIAQSSADYEHDIWLGKRPIIGRNTLALEDPAEIAVELIRPNPEDWQKQIARTRTFREDHQDIAPLYLQELKKVAEEGGNVFEELLTTTRYATLGQISHVLGEAGGRFNQVI